MSRKATNFASIWSRLAHGGQSWIVPQRVNWWRKENLQGGKSSVFYLPVLFEGDVSWQCGRGLKINVAKGGSDSLSAGALLLGGLIGLGCHFCYLILCMWPRQTFSSSYLLLSISHVCCFPAFLRALLQMESGSNAALRLQRRRGCRLLIMFTGWMQSHGFKK